MYKRNISQVFLITLFLLFTSNVGAVESPLWQQFKTAKETGTEPTLPDFSYAGYDYSESAIPDTSSWTVFNVTDYGAVADDGDYDDDAIRAAINAAETAGGGVVLFPSGRFMISPDEVTPGQPIIEAQKIFISGSNIVLKGQGSQPGGTEIFMDKMKASNGDHIFEITPDNTGESTVTQVVEDALRETFEITVANASALSVGQRIILRTDSVDFAEDYFHPQAIDAAWTRLLSTQGFRLREIHTIAEINGNVVRLREPLHITLTTGTDPINVRTYNVIENVGIEDILFKGNWDSYFDEENGGVFNHHYDDIHDYGWNAIRIDNVANGWIRNVEFKDWNQGIYIDGAAAMTIENISFTGKKGHTSVHTRRSYGVLIKDSQDFTGHHHGPGLGYSAAGTVYLRYQMFNEQRMDSHTGSPYVTLFDNVSNGHFDGNGGPHESYPHHGKYFVAWNFLLEGGTNDYNFWPPYRNGHTFAMPFFIGLQGDSVTMTNGTFSANELPGQSVEPASLFEAQLNLRLGINTLNFLPPLLDLILKE